MQEARELANDPCTDYAAAPLEVSLPSMASAVPSAHVPALAGRYLREYWLRNGLLGVTDVPVGMALHYPGTSWHGV